MSDTHNETVHTEVPPAVTAALMTAPNGQAKHDPLWNTRRRRLDASLIVCFGLSIYSMKLGTAMAAVVIPPAFLFAASIIGAYMGFAEWGRINGVVAAPVATPGVNSAKD